MLRHSREFIVPRRTKLRAIRKWNRTHDSSLTNVMTGREWWHGFRDSFTCAFWARRQSVDQRRCAGPAVAAIRRPMVDAGRLVIVCGGAGLIGSYRGGWWGVGTGVGACFWTRYFDNLW